MLNRCEIIGNCGKDPEMSYTPSGKATTRVSVAVTRKYKDKTTDERKEATQWFNVVLWEGLAEVANQYLHKGSKVYFAGRIGSRDYTDKEGAKRTIWELVATDMELVGVKDEGSTKGDDRDAPPPDDGVPF